VRICVVCPYDLAEEGGVKRHCDHLASARRRLAIDAADPVRCSVPLVRSRYRRVVGSIALRAERVSQATHDHPQRNPHRAVCSPSAAIRRHRRGPAVLVEVGFIDHPIEGRQLAEPAVQAQLADAIAEAIMEQLAD
jgi:N-acetylmuramoyl-L-alanine amidase